MRIEWAMACDGARATPDGQLEALGRPIDTTGLDEFPCDDFSLDVVLCLVSEGEKGGGSTPIMRYVVNAMGSDVAYHLEFPTPVTVLPDDDWPVAVSLRGWSVLTVRFPVPQPALYEIAIGLDEQQPVRFWHRVKRDA
jgi:hypothetical protein